jgi:ribosomal protein S18 acetylase RimI-like enzyme
MMLIRPSISKDASSLALLSLEVWSATYLRRGINAFFADYALKKFSKPSFEAALCDPLEIFLVAERNKLLQGYIRLRLNSDCGLEDTGVAEIRTLYVRPPHHNRGIGKALLRAGLSTLEAGVHGSPWLAVNAQNKEAIGFYTTQGFERVGKRNFCIEDTRFLNYILSYAVSPTDACQKAMQDG